jgi:hypothetical protein
LALKQQKKGEKMRDIHKHRVLQNRSKDKRERRRESRDTQGPLKKTESGEQQTKVEKRQREKSVEADAEREK